MPSVNRAYYRELARYTIAHHAYKPFQFAVVNDSATVARDVRIELSTPANKTLLLDDVSWPKLPPKDWDVLKTMNLPMKDEVEIEARHLDERWIVDITVEKVQPHSTAWVKGFLYIGRQETGDIVLSGTVSADNLPKPQPVSLTVHASTEAKTIDLEQLLRVETERFLASPEGQRWQERLERGK